MDFSLGAPKLLCAQLKFARRAHSDSSQSSCFTFAGIIFQRAWLQGILVSTPNDASGRFLLDDGTGVIELDLSIDFCKGRWEVGAYVMVVGAYIEQENDLPMIKVHKIVNLSAYPDREAMWYLEVIEAFKLFYLPILEQLQEEGTMNS